MKKSVGDGVVCVRKQFTVIRLLGSEELKIDIGANSFLLQHSKLLTSVTPNIPWQLEII